MKQFYFPMSLAVLSACNLMTARQPENATPPSTIIMAYFVSNQTVTDDQNLSSQMSDFSGSAIAATSNSNFGKWINPPSICDYTQNFSVDVTAKRNLNLGNLVIGRGTQTVTVQANPTDYSWGFTGRLDPTQYTLEPDGVKGTAHYLQNWTILPTSADIKVYANSMAATPFQLPSPKTPATTDTNYELKFSRNQPLLVAVKPVNGANLIRVRIKDGSNRNMGDVTCYEPPNVVFSIPPNLLRTFRTGSDGILQIDQISFSHLQDVTRVSESLVISATRQVHGLIEYLDSNNELQQLNLGKLTITD